MDLAIPVIPSLVTALLAFFSPYATAIVVSPLWPAKRKKLVSIVVSLILAAIVLVLAILAFGMVMPAWPVLLLLAVITAQASYDLILKNSANALAAKHGTGSTEIAVP